MLIQGQAYILNQVDLLLLKKVIFYYGIFKESEKTLSDHGVGLHYLCTWWDVLREAKAQSAFDSKTLHEVEQFLNDPRAWQNVRNPPEQS